MGSESATSEGSGVGEQQQATTLERQSRPEERPIKL